jgi:hypothetical protein
MIDDRTAKELRWPYPCARSPRRVRLGPLAQLERRLPSQWGPCSIALDTKRCQAL